MATTTIAIETIAQAAGLPLNTIISTARVLRGRDGVLWPIGSQGKGGAAHVYPDHLANMLLALSADTVTGCADTVIKLREFIFYPTAKTAPSRILGHALTTRINDIAAGELPDTALEITIDRIGTKMARVTFMEHLDLEEVGRGAFQSVYVPPEGMPPVVGTEVFYGLHVKQPFLEVLAELWNDTKRSLSLRTNYNEE